MTDRLLKQIIEGCIHHNAASQKELFLYVYDYGMSVAARYGSSLQETEEIANDAFYKMLKHIKQYQSHIPFKLWLRRIVINTGIDHFRKQRVRVRKIDLPNLQRTYNAGSEKLDKDDLLELLNSLSPQYKLVFILHVIEGYSHEEIADKLQISIGTSKSNLSKARANLKKQLAKQEMNENY